MDENTGPAERRYRVLYDPVLKRPGCVILAAVFGADRSVPHRFESRDWLVAPTPDMAVFETTETQLNQLVKITEANR